MAELRSGTFFRGGCRYAQSPSPHERAGIAPPCEFRQVLTLSHPDPGLIELLLLRWRRPNLMDQVERAGWRRRWLDPCGHHGWAFCTEFDRKPPLVKFCAGQPGSLDCHLMIENPGPFYSELRRWERTISRDERVRI